MIVRHDLLLTSAAEFSPCERYRYTLRRCFDGDVLEPPVRPLVFVMLNPSIADAMKDDPTVAKCRKWAIAWGYSDLMVANLFALRSTDPEALAREVDPVGKENNGVLASIPADADVVVAWGNHKAAQSRWRDVVKLLGPRELLCLHRNQDGSPGHPLYLKNDTKPVTWRPR